MTDSLGAVLFVLYLAGVGAVATLWPYVVRKNQMAALAVDIAPGAVCLWLAALTVAWPGVALYGLAFLLVHLARKTK
jgi:hypothetical protein